MRRYKEDSAYYRQGIVFEYDETDMLSSTAAFDEAAKELHERILIAAAIRNIWGIERKPPETFMKFRVGKTPGGRPIGVLESLLPVKPIKKQNLMAAMTELDKQIVREDPFRYKAEMLKERMDTTNILMWGYHNSAIADEDFERLVRKAVGDSFYEAYIAASKMEHQGELGYEMPKVENLKACWEKIKARRYPQELEGYKNW